MAGRRALDAAAFTVDPRARSRGRRLSAASCEARPRRGSRAHRGAGRSRHPASNVARSLPPRSLSRRRRDGPIRPRSGRPPHPGNRSAPPPLCLSARPMPRPRRSRPGSISRPAQPAWRPANPPDCRRAWCGGRARGSRDVPHAWRKNGRRQDSGRRGRHRVDRPERNGPFSAVGRPGHLERARARPLRGGSGDAHHVSEEHGRDAPDRAAPLRTAMAARGSHRAIPA